ncbi:TipAS antibiotic-recognition domain-containing protein [Streptomyces sp. SBT349]|uniref:TipAS antibiotic-recognition domain-containing protein n=1 Tax=Streptomyces sp. SBT349 TaxID=1580539 RepID=UPI000AC9E51C|nr:TipAS antibiotic-recognition domain-containing protein [Streptomyces sp. SBT349]
MFHLIQWKYAERAAERTPEDWKRVAARTDALIADLGAAMRAGLAPGSEEANALAERHRALMSGYFDCTHAMQVCLGRMFVDEAGWAEYYDAVEPGLTVWLRDVIFANAEVHGVDPESARWE